MRSAGRFLQHWQEAMLGFKQGNQGVRTELDGAQYTETEGTETERHARLDIRHSGTLIKLTEQGVGRVGQHELQKKPNLQHAGREVLTWAHVSPRCWGDGDEAHWGSCGNSETSDIRVPPSRESYVRGTTGETGLGGMSGEHRGGCTSEFEKRQSADLIHCVPLHSHTAPSHSLVTARSHQALRAWGDSEAQPRSALRALTVMATCILWSGHNSEPACYSGCFMSG